MVGFGIGDGYIGAIGKVDGPRSHNIEFGSETIEATGPKGLEIGQEDETAAGGNELNCIIAGLTPYKSTIKAGLSSVDGTAWVTVWEIPTPPGFFPNPSSLIRRRALLLTD
jgi:hypothetical protein